MSTAVSVLLTSSGTSATYILRGACSAESDSAIRTLVAWPLIGLAVTTRTTRTTARTTAKAALYRGWVESLSVSLEAFSRSFALNFDRPALASIMDMSPFNEWPLPVDTARS